MAMQFVLQSQTLHNPQSGDSPEHGLLGAGQEAGGDAQTWVVKPALQVIWLKALKVLQELLALGHWGSQESLGRWVSPWGGGALTIRIFFSILRA